jgi:hypothetical protein
MIDFVSQVKSTTRRVFSFRPRFLHDIHHHHRHHNWHFCWITGNGRKRRRNEQKSKRYTKWIHEQNDGSFEGDSTKRDMNSWCIIRPTGLDATRKLAVSTYTEYSLSFPAQTYKWRMLSRDPLSCSMMSRETQVFSSWYERWWNDVVVTASSWNAISERRPSHDTSFDIQETKKDHRSFKIDREISGTLTGCKINTKRIYTCHESWTSLQIWSDVLCTCV